MTVATKSGERRTVTATDIRVENEHGKALCTISVHKDIGERRQMEDLLQRRLVEIEDLKSRVLKEQACVRQEARSTSEYEEEIIGESEAFKRVLTQARQVARTESTVLLLGETGTGKEVIARFIHAMSGRKDRQLVTVNCASLPPSLIESELFGREKGAYTGALTSMVGRFELANGSTLFLDEIGELPYELQSKLLHVLETGRFERLGSVKTVQTNARLIAATNRDLAEAMRKGRFREDLYYRLNVFPIHIPPLKERAEDIELLAKTFINEFAQKMGKKIPGIQAKTIETLQRYSWPGNIRELRNVIEQAVIMYSGDKVTVNLPQLAAEGHPGERNLRAVQHRHIVEILKTTGWRIKGPGGAAEVLGMRPSTLYSRMESLGIPTRRMQTDSEAYEFLTEEERRYGVSDQGIQHEGFHPPE